VLLVDTSVWIDHLRRGDKRLAELLRANEVACHPFIIGELACGQLRQREEILTELSALRRTPKAEDDEVLRFIDGHRLMGKRLGLIDIHLLASCKLAGIGLWTRDKRLAAAAAELGLADPVR